MFSLKNVPIAKDGKKYGLLPINKTLKPEKKLVGKPPSFFGVDDDEESEGNERQRVQKYMEDEQARKLKEKQLKKTYSNALEQDCTIFQYDEVYDEISSGKKTEKKEDPSEQRKEPRYIGNLIKLAQIRNIERDRIYERKLQKEAEQEAKENGPAEMKFVTTAYKEKLREQKRWELEERAEEQFEEIHSATKIGMGAFYSNLLTKNIAMGGDVEKSARSAFTSGSKLNGKMNANSINPASSEKTIQLKLSQEETCTRSPVIPSETSFPNVRNNIHTEHEEIHHIEKKQKVDSAVHSVTTQSEQTTTDKKASVLSAKERYLQRKRENPS